MKKMIGIIGMGLGVLVLTTGCTSSFSSKNEQVAQVPYSVYEKAIVVDSQKVLVDGSYETLEAPQIEKRKGEVTLYKTVVFYKDKNTTLFFGREVKVGSHIEFIFKNNEMTNITLP